MYVLIFAGVHDDVGCCLPDNVLLMGWFFSKLWSKILEVKNDFNQHLRENLKDYILNGTIGFLAMAVVFIVGGGLIWIIGQASKYFFQ